MTQQAEEATRLVFEARQSGILRREGLGPLRACLEHRLGDGYPPSLDLAVVTGEGPVLRAAGGHACIAPERVPAAPRTSYDLASLTKVICTVTLVMLGRERGALSLEEPVVKWLPNYLVPEVTLWHLLTHTAGLPAHRPFYAKAMGRAAVEAALYEEAAKALSEGSRPGGPGGAVVYSDLGFMLAGWALEACLGRPLDELFATEVAGPLGMERAHFCPTASERALTAATELDGDQRTPGPMTDVGPAERLRRSGANGLAAEPGVDEAPEPEPRRTQEPRLIWGEVHDGNAWALGGVAGHAGLFATADDLVPFVRALLDPASARLLTGESVELMNRVHAESSGEVRGLGWRLRPSAWGDWSESALWHTGFTGTSVLVDRQRGVGVVLLTNAVHPRRRLPEQAELRAEIHGLVAGALRS
jgi:CubicO group peptidase (beta-lactamase class C family)